MPSLKDLTSLLPFFFLVACGGEDQDAQDGEPSSGGAGGTGGVGAASTGGIGSGGTPATAGGGGTMSSGAAPGAGGQPGAGGDTATGGQAGTGGGPDQPVDCSISIDRSEPSPDMGSVGVVEFTSDLTGITEATVEFGKTTEYGLQAPVDLQAESYRTLLLGLPFGSELNYRITVRAGSQVCTSENHTLSLGNAPGEVDVDVSLDSPQAGATEDGYIVTAHYQGGTVFIVNLEGKLVWAKTISLGGISQARMSYDAKYIYARNGNPNGTAGGGGFPGGGSGGQIVRLSMDGSQEVAIDAPTSHHDLTVIPNGSLVYLRRSESVPNCDAIVERTFDGQESVIYEFADAFPSFNRSGNGDDCHVNAVRYNEHDQTLSLSALMLDSMINIGLDGTLNWVIGRVDSTLDMSGLDWDRQHGMSMSDSSTLVFFNNGGNSEHGDGNSVVLKLSLGESAIAVDPWFYDSNNATNSQGDVQILPNDNVLVTYSNDGVSHEADGSGNRVRTIDYGGAVGYANYRDSLYGPPLH